MVKNEKGSTMGKRSKMEIYKKWEKVKNEKGSKMEKCQ